MNDYLSILSVLVPVLMMVGVGFLAHRFGWIAAEAQQGLFRLSINVLVPCLIFESVAWNPALQDFENVVIPPAMGFFSIVIGIGLSYMVGRMWLKKGGGLRTFALCTGFYNYGYIALPLALLLFDKETVGVLLVFNVGVEFALWSVGVWVLSGGSLLDSWRRILNMPLMAIILAVIANRTGSADLVPDVLIATIHWLAPCAIPVGIILVGATIGGFARDFSFRQGRLSTVLGCVLRLGVLPPVLLLIAFALPISVELKRVVVIQAAMSSGVTPILLSKFYNGHPQVAMRIVVATTALGVVTIPFWIRVGLKLLGE